MFILYNYGSTIPNNACLTLSMPTSIQNRKIDDPRYYLINTSLSLTFLTKQLPLAGLFPSKSGLQKPNLP